MMFRLSENSLPAQPSPAQQGVFEFPATQLPYPESEGIQNEGHECLEGS